MTAPIYRAGMRAEAVPMDLAVYGRCVWEGCREEGKIPPGRRWMTCPKHTTREAEITHALTTLRGRELSPVDTQVPNAVFNGTGIAAVQGPRGEPYFSDKTAEGYARCDPGNCRWVPAWAATVCNYFQVLRKVLERDQSMKWVNVTLNLCVQRPELRDSLVSMLNLNPPPAALVAFVTAHKPKDLLV